MKNLALFPSRLVLLATCLAITGWSQIPDDGSQLPGGKHIFPTRSYTPPPPPLGAIKAAATTGNGIDYHGGPLILGTVNVYYIFYGNWSGAAGANAMAILQNLAANIGGSPYYNINTTYNNAAGTSVSNSVHFGGSALDNYSQGTSFDDTGVANIVTLAISSGSLPSDTNGVYFVLTSSDVGETSGFCSNYCGWHFFGTLAGADIKYAFVGNSSACLANCATQSTSPNGDAGADAMASIIAHELEEAVSDPHVSAWYDSRGNENADKCVWTYGSTYSAGNGSSANMNLGGRDYLIQENWLNASGGSCALSYALPGPTLTSVAPASGLQGTTVSVTLTGTGFSPTSTVNVSGSGIQVSNPIVSGTTQITADFIIAGNAAVGGYNVSVTASSATTLPRTFTVTSLVPTLTSVSPPSGAPGASVPVTLTGTNFVSGATVGITGSGVTPVNVTVVNSQQISATFNVASGATLGGYSVTVTTTNGISGPVIFTVAPPTPTLTSISPSSASPGSNTPVTLTGTNLISPATLNIGGSGVTASGVTVVGTTQITANLSVASNATTGVHNISASMSNGTTGAVGFTVNGSSGGGGGGSGPPSLSGISPSVGKAGTTVKVTLTGKSLTSLSSIPIQITGGGVTFTSVTPVGTSGTTLTANFVIASSATKSRRFVSVRNTTGISNTIAFTIQ